LTRATTASKFDGKIQAFLDEYLSSDDPDGPVFGGRDAELEQLDSWLHDPGAPPRFVLTAPAGRGKSALLVHWIYRLQQQQVDADAWNLLFVPISIRFRTNRPEVFFEAIAARLAELVGVELQPPSSDPIAWFEDQCRLLLDQAIEQQKRILVVIDGIDETLGDRFSATWVPRAPGARLRVLVSARLQVGDRDSRNWADRLGWRGGLRVQTRNLPPLPPKGVADLLVIAGLHGPDLSPEFSARLHALTEGEPLVLKLLVEDLRQRAASGQAIAVEDLLAIKPGLAGYFEDWFDRQREVWRSERRDGEPVDEAVVSAFLAVLACAFGPLMADDLNAIAGRLYSVPIAFRTGDSLHPLRRFIIGTGRGSGEGASGFVLSHPRLAEFLREEHFDAARVEQTRAAFADWGTDLLRRLGEGALSPARVPAYALEYLAQHLEENGTGVARFLPLTEQPWLRAWEALEGGYRGFARDVAHVRRLIEQHGQAADPSFAWQLRCQLILSSIASSGANIPPELLVRCVAENVLPLRQALHWAEYQAPEDRLRALAGLAPYVMESQQPALLTQALDAAAAIVWAPGDYSKLRPLADLMPILPDPLVRRAFDLVSNHTAGWLRGVSGQPVADPFDPLHGLLAEELSTADMRHACQALLSPIPGHWCYSDEVSRLLIAVGPMLPEPLVARAVAEIRGVRNAFTSDTLALAALAISIRTGHDLIPYRQILDGLDGFFDEGDRGNLLAALAPVLPQEFAPEVLDLVLRFERRDHRAATLSKLADFLGPDVFNSAIPSLALAEVGVDAFVAVVPKLAESERVAVIASAPQAADPSSVATRSRMIVLAWQYLPASFLAAQIPWALSIADAPLRAEVLASIAARCPEAVTPDIRSRVIEACRSIPDAWRRCAVVTSVASRGIGNGELIGVALDAASTLSADWACAESLALIAPYLDDTQTRRAFAIVCQMKEATRRIEALSAIAPRLPFAMLHDVLEQAPSIAGEAHLHELLAVIAPLLQSGQHEIALALACKIPDRKRLLAALAVLTPHLPGVLLSQALAAARGIGDERERATLLCSIASLLREDANDLLRDALACLDSVRGERDRAEALAALGPLVPRDACTHALASLHAFKDPFCRCTVVAGMAAVLGPTACEAQIEDAVNAAALIEDETDRAQAFLCLLPQLSGTTRRRVLLASYEAIRRAALDIQRVRMFANLLDHIATIGPSDAGVATKTDYGGGDDDDEDTADGSGGDDEDAAARRLSANRILAVATEDALRIQSDSNQVCELAPLFRHLTKQQLDKLYPNLAATIRSELLWCVPAIADAAAVFSAEDYEQVIREAFEKLVPTEITEGWELDPFLVLAPQLPATMHRRMLAASLSLSSGRGRPQLLRLLGSLLPAIAGQEGITGLREISRAVRETATWFH
jgi:hypothetical protein